MANPTPYTVLMTRIDKVENNAQAHAKAAIDHGERHLSEIDAKRNGKRPIEHPAGNASTTGR